MQLFATRQFDLNGGRYSILTVGDWTIWLAEREWKANRRNISCVPRGRYTLEEHDSRKYPGTYALVGESVSHYPDPSRARFACVLHSVTLPIYLEGCLAPARSISASGELIDSSGALKELLAALVGHETNELFLI